MALYTRDRVTLVFYDDKKKDVNGGKVLEQAPFVFVEMGVGLNFVRPVNRCRVNADGNKCDWDIVGIQVIDGRRGLPSQPGGLTVTGTYRTQFFGDV